MSKDTTKNLVGQPKRKKSFEKYYAFDSTTITLFSDVMKGVGRNPKGDGNKKRSLTVLDEKIQQILKSKMIKSKCS